MEGDTTPPSGQGTKPGGPKTANGKRASAANALKHGLSSRKYVPNILQAERFDNKRRELILEYAPVTFTERFLVEEMARHAAMLEVAATGEQASFRHHAREISGVLLNGQVPEAVDDVIEDAILSGTMSSDKLGNYHRYRRGHEKAYFAALKKLQELQAARRQISRAGGARTGNDSHDEFQDENVCEEYLRTRFQHADWRCPKCGHDHGHWLGHRKTWQCSRCRRQVGLRAETVMARSPLPLIKWFAAIRLILNTPNTPNSDVARVTGIRRPATVKRVAARIRQAMTAANATTLLVGLDDRAREPNNPVAQRVEPKQG